MIVNVQGMKRQVMLLPIMKKWYDMILSGDKKEEYRDFKTYYHKRFQTAGMIADDAFTLIPGEYLVCFRNGYSSSSPQFFAYCTLRVGTGKPEWGAEEGKNYYILQISKIVKEKGAYNE